MATGHSVKQWRNSALSRTREQRVDLLGETRTGTLVHIELQSTNQARMSFRMSDYAHAICAKFGRFPHQLVLYVGRGRMRMNGALAGPHIRYECPMLDIRELETAPLLRSASLEDNVIAVLTRRGGNIETVREILLNISRASPEDRNRALVELALVGSLRQLENVIEREANDMPVLGGILDNKLVAREYKRGLKIGREAGRLQGERSVLSALIRKRFGSLPDWAEKSVAGIPGDQLERFALRLLDAQTLEELLG
jgi:predicted transposase YdaD